jgi:hypothetical protein
LIRDWQGKSHHVTVLERGVLYRKKNYRSLSQVDADPGDGLDGVEVETSVENVPEIFSIEFSYNPRRPLNWGTTIGDTYLSNSVPYVAVFKPPVDPKMLDYRFFRGMAQQPDLQLIPAPGSGTMLVVRNTDEEKKSDFLSIGGLEYKRISMPHDDWSPSGNVMALKDLEGAQAILYCPPFVCRFTNLSEVWDASKPGNIALVINGQRIDFDMTHLTTTTTSHYGKVYSYVFPRFVAF